MLTPTTEEGFFPQIDITTTEDKSLVAYRQGIKELHESTAFYTYIHLHNGDEIFYVGIGHGDRASRTISHRSHSKKWQAVVERKGRPFDVIVRSGLTKEEAQASEKTLIAWYRSKGMSLVNDHKGGVIPTWEASCRGGWTLLKRAASLRAGAAWSRRVKALALAAFPITKESQEVFSL